MKILRQPDWAKSKMIHLITILITNKITEHFIVKQEIYIVQLFSAIIFPVFIYKSISRVRGYREKYQLYYINNMYSSSAPSQTDLN